MALRRWWAERQKKPKNCANVYGTGIPRRTKAGIPESPAGKSAIQPPSRVGSAHVSGRPGRTIRERVRCRGKYSGCEGCSESFFFSCGFGSGRAGLWRGLAVCGCRSVPDSGCPGSPDPRRDPGPISGAFRSRFWSRFPTGSVAIRERVRVGYGEYRRQRNQPGRGIESDAHGVRSQEGRGPGEDRGATGGGRNSTSCA